MTRTEATDAVVEAARYFRIHGDHGTQCFRHADGCCCGRTEIMTALAALEAAPDDGWRPIETAPKDGTALLMCNSPPGVRPGSVFIGFYYAGKHNPGWYEDGQDMDIALDVKVTHWRPLPPPPATREEDDERQETGDD